MSSPLTVGPWLDAKLATAAPSRVVGGTLAALAAAHVVHQLLRDGRVHRKVLGAVFSTVRAVGAPIVAAQVNKAAAGVSFPQGADEKVFEALPSVGMGEEALMTLIAQLHATLDHAYTEGGCSGAVYHGGDDFTRFINKVMEVFQWSNPLHVDVFGATRKMEAEVVSMVVDMYNGRPRGACGALTSGGTESIGMAVKTYRDWGRAVLGVASPNIVAPITAHPAFDKAAGFYGIRLVKVPVGPSGRVDPALLASYINAETVAIVGSAPTFPHGTVDPIAALAAIAAERGIGMHVDACLGGFIMPFLAAAGFEAPIVDFRLPGVTTISCDTHKYGFAPKGTSVIMYASKALRRFQFFTVSDWPGGIYCSPGASGSKPGNVIAGTWASMLHHGRQGYINSCKKIVGARLVMSEGLRRIPGIRILGTPTASVFAFTADTVDTYVLNDRLKKRGWMLNPLQFPSGLQFSVTLLQAQDGLPQRFVADVAELVEDLLREYAEKRARGEAVRIGVDGGTMYGSQQRIPDRAILDMVMTEYLNGYYGTQHGSHNIQS